MQKIAILGGFGLFGILLFIVLPWLTFISLNEVFDGDSFDIGDWLATFWLMLVFGGASAAASRA